MIKLKDWFDKLKGEKIIFLLSSLFFGLEYFIFGPFSYARGSDNMDSLIPRAVDIWKTIFSGGGLSYWQPFLIGGTDRMANIASFNEITNLLFILPGWIALALAVVGACYLGSYYIYRLSHDTLGLSKKASFTAGILFPLAFISNYPPFAFGIAILPGVLYYLEKVFSSQKLPWLAKSLLFVVLGVVYSFFSSLSLTMPFVSIIIVLWFLFFRKQKSVLFYAMLLLFFIPSVLLKIQEAWALLACTPFSTRGEGAVYFKVSFKAYFSSVAFIFKAYYPAIIAALSGLFFARKNRLFLKLSIFSLILIFIPKAYPALIAASNFGKYFGPFQNFDFSRFVLLIPFFCSLAAGYAVEEAANLKMAITSPEGKNFIIKPQNVFIVFCLVLVLFFSLSDKEKNFNSWLKFGSYRSYTYSPDIAVIKKETDNSAPFRVASMSPRPIKFFMASLPNFQGVETIDGYADVGFERATEVFRLMAKDNGVKSNLYFLMNIDSQSALKVADDFDPAKLININLLSLFNTRYIISDNLINSPDLQLIETPNAANWQKWDKMSEMQKIKFRIAENFSGRKLLIYENKKAFPRFFLTKKVRAFASENELLAALATSTAAVLRENVFLVKSDADKISKLGGRAENIKIEKYSNDEIKLKVESDGPSVLVISNNFSPFWEALVNGEKKEIMPADHALQAVFLTASSSEVDLVYNPPYKF